MMQNSGLAVVADKLNFIRYLSHFRCVHRGAAFAKMRTTTVRKLLPESWGFLCPVHTPDGEPCGLMNHMTASCEIVAQSWSTVSLPGLLCSLGGWLLCRVPSEGERVCVCVPETWHDGIWLFQGMVDQLISLPINRADECDFVHNLPI